MPDFVHSHIVVFLLFSLLTGTCRCERNNMTNNMRTGTYLDQIQTQAIPSKSV